MKKISDTYALIKSKSALQKVFTDKDIILDMRSHGFTLSYATMRKIRTLKGDTPVSSTVLRQLALIYQINMDELIILYNKERFFLNQSQEEVIE